MCINITNQQNFLLPAFPMEASHVCLCCIWDHFPMWSLHEFQVSWKSCNANLLCQLCMADRGFTIQDQLNALGIKLNIPLFIEGRNQLPTEEVQNGRKIASLQIHVECARGWIKNFSIIKGTFPLSCNGSSCQNYCLCVFLAYKLSASPCSTT